VLDLAERHRDWPMPGYTHLQRAQPVYLGHHLLAYAWMFLRDRGRFAQVVEACWTLPLGAGALAGVNFATDRGAAARELGFAPSPNSIDAVSNRDFALDYLAPRRPARCTCRGSARARPLEQQRVRLLRACRRLDVGLLDHAAEEEPRRRRAAARQGAARGAHHSALLGVMHGLPLTYNKDLQEDKEHLFDTADTLAGVPRRGARDARAR
jgi:argininosuccinate lyase